MPIYVILFYFGNLYLYKNYLLLNIIIICKFHYTYIFVEMKFKIRIKIVNYKKNIKNTV